MHVRDLAADGTRSSALSAFVEEMAGFKDEKQHAAGDDAEIAKVRFVVSILRLARTFGFDGDLSEATVAAAVRTNSLPTFRSSYDLLDLAADPAALEFAGNYDHWCRARFTDLSGAPSPDIIALLLAAGLLKYMGWFDGAARIYEMLTQSELARAHAAIGLGDLHLTAALYARHLNEHLGVWPFPPDAAAGMLASALRWSRPIGFEHAARHFDDAVRQKSDLALTHYASAICHRSQDDRAAAAANYALARHHSAPDAHASLLEQEERHRRSDLPLREVPPPRDPLIGFIDSEVVATTYDIYHASGVRTVRHSHSSRALQSRRVTDAWPMAPSLTSIRDGDSILADTIMFTGHERPMWEPSLSAWNAGRATYAKATPIACDTPVILLGGLGSFYYHFLFDVIGALCVVPRPTWTGRQIVFSTFENASGTPSRWQSEILSMMGIPAAILHRGETFYRDAVVASYPSQDNRIVPGVVRFLREKLARPGRADPRNLIYFSRSAGRTVESDSARGLRSIVEAAGFRCIDPLRLSVRRQRDLLADCGVFLCEAGSGLANLIFLPEGCRVITLATALTFKDYFCSVASLLNMEMSVVLSDIASMYPRQEFHWSSFNPTVDLAALERCVTTTVRQGTRAS